MPQVEIRALGDSRTSETLKPASVLVVLVVKDGISWLAQCLVSLSRQTHPRIGVLAVDNGSTDGSPDVLVNALGEDRVIRLDRNAGWAGAVGEALRSPMAGAADYLLFLHDDTFLAPEAVASMVEAAEAIEGVGIVGPKILDWSNPEILRDIGQSTDRFGFVYSPLEEGEIDQGQYDRIREVLFVSSAAMLISKPTWSRIGLPDERLSLQREDLDYCWRARLAGFRVIMTPRAVARHRGAWTVGERPGSDPIPRVLYERERAALATMLKNYGPLSLAWLLPLYLVGGIGRLLLLSVARRFEDGYQILAAWGWNVAHLPGTFIRRLRAQSIRRVPDRSVRRSMASTGIRLRRLVSMAGRSLTSEGKEADRGTTPSMPRVVRFALDHPVLTASTLGVLLALVAYRNLWMAAPLLGPGLGTPPGSAAAFFRELVSGLRSTGLGGSHAASPALGMLGLGSLLAFGSPALLQKVMILGLPAVGAAACYQAVRSIVAVRMPSVVAAAAYGVSSLMLWAVSEGRMETLVFLAGVPWLAGKAYLAFDARRPVAPGRWVVGAGLGLAVLASFYPGAALAGALLSLTALALPTSGSERVRGGLLVMGAVLVAAVLVFPLSLELLRGGGASFADPGGEASFGSLLRLSPGPGPGSWLTGYYLPGAAFVSLLSVPRESARTAGRAALGAVASVYLAWLAAAGYLPPFMSNPAAYLGVAAFGYVLLVALGLRSLIAEVSRSSFGRRQLGAAAITLLLGVGLAAQAFQAARGTWAIGSADRVSDAYPVVGAERVPPYRVLWLGAAGAGSFAPPGGIPDGTVPAGDASVGYGVRSPAGASELDVARPATGPGYVYLERALEEVLAGEVRHAGAVLAPLGIRYVVASEGDLAPVSLHRLSRQVDLDRIPAGSLIVFRNAKALPISATVAGEAWTEAARGSGPAAAVSLPAPPAIAMQARGSSFTGFTAEDPSAALLGQQFDPRWRLDTGGPSGDASLPVRAFGWEAGFPLPTGARTFSISFHGQASRTGQTGALAVLWVAAAWATRRRRVRA